MPKEILLIDDDRTNIVLIKTRLENKGFTVSSAADGEIGLNLAKIKKPDLIVLDVEMPKMNGYTFLNELRKTDDLKATPVVVLTAHAQHQPIFGLKGVKAYFVKPINVEALIEKINSCLNLPIE